MIDNQNSYISEKLKEYFFKEGITQEEIAKKLGVSQAYVSAMLNGKPFGKTTAKKWGELFNIKPSWLLTGDGQMLLTDQNKETEELSSSFNQSENNIAEFIKMLNEKDAEIKLLREERDKLLQENNYMKGLLDKNSIPHRQTS